MVLISRLVQRAVDHSPSIATKHSQSETGLSLAAAADWQHPRRQTPGQLPPQHQGAGLERDWSPHLPPPARPGWGWGAGRRAGVVVVTGRAAAVTAPGGSPWPAAWSLRDWWLCNNNANKTNATCI